MQGEIRTTTTDVTAANVAKVNYPFGWSGVAKVSCILRHRGRPTDTGLQFARLTILVAGKGRGGGEFFYFFCFFTFIPVPLSAPFSSFMSFTISPISLLLFSGRRHKMTHKELCVKKRQHNQSKTRGFEIASSISVFRHVFCCPKADSCKSRTARQTV